MGISQPAQDTYPYCAIVSTSSGTIITGVPGKKIVASFTGTLFGTQATIIGVQNGQPATVLLAWYGPNTPIPIASPQNIEFDAGTSVTYTITGGAGAINAAWYLKN